MSRTLVLALLLTACSGGDADDEETDGFDPSVIPSGPLEGLIGGEPWTFASGVTDSFLDDEEDFFTTFYGVDAVSCDDWPEDGNHLVGSVPTEPGTYEFGFTQNVTFYIRETNENLVATTGGMVVDSVDGGVAKGAMFATFDEDNEVGGEFEVVICAD